MCVIACLSAGGGLCLTGCGGAGGAGGSVIINPPPGGISVTLSPQNASVSVGNQIQFSANVSGTGDHRVSWSVAGAGSIDPNGLFTASSQPGSATVYAASMVQPSASASTFVTVTSDADQWVTWSGNGHRYRAVCVPEGITWSDAKQAAEADGAYLATITSAEENVFVFDLVDNPKYWNQRPPGNPGYLGPWLGGRAPLGRPDPQIGWTWVTGEIWSFSNWQTSEPSSSGEDSLQFISTHAGQRTAQWNDLIGDSLDIWNTPVIGYVEEIGSYNPPPLQGQLAFTSSRDGNEEIYTCNLDGSNLVNLSRNGARDVWCNWAPDGNSLLFSSLRTGNFEIFRMNADGSSPTQISHNGGGPGNPDTFNPCWLPDGSKIIFQTGRDWNWEIYQMNPDGSGLENLTKNGNDDVEPSVSSDGNRIAFASTRDGGYQIYVMNRDGSGQTRLTYGGSIDTNPGWSPDGSKLAFMSNRDGDYEIYVMNSDGTNIRQITMNAAWDGEPSWSPDGQHIAFASDRSGVEQIYYADADGTNVIQVPCGAANNGRPVWRPNH